MKNLESLRSMGCAWFVSYHYSQKADATHTNWKNTPTTQMRIGFYERTTEDHHAFLEYILRVPVSSLSRNTLGLSGAKVKEMAKELLTK